MTARFESSGDTFPEAWFVHRCSRLRSLVRLERPTSSSSDEEACLGEVDSAGIQWLHQKSFLFQVTDAITCTMTRHDHPISRTPNLNG
jgi:hypothetical protein